GRVRDLAARDEQTRAGGLAGSLNGDRQLRANHRHAPCREPVSAQERSIPHACPQRSHGRAPPLPNRRCQRSRSFVRTIPTVCSTSQRRRQPRKIHTVSAATPTVTPSKASIRTFST